MPYIHTTYATLNINTGLRCVADTQAEAERYAAGSGTFGDYVETLVIDPLNNEGLVRAWRIGEDAIREVAA